MYFKSVNRFVSLPEQMKQGRDKLDTLIDDLLETLRSRLFGISREPRTSRSHVTTGLASGLQFEVRVFMARPRSRGK